jgi:IS5 family transposase
VQAARPGGASELPATQAIIEPVLGVLKEQRGLRGFRLRGLVKAGMELTLACAAYNLTRMWRMAPRCTG